MFALYWSYALILLWPDFVFTVWSGCTPEQLWSLAVDPSGHIGDTDTQYLLTALSSTDTDTATSDNNLWADRENRFNINFTV